MTVSKCGIDFGRRSLRGSAETGAAASPRSHEGARESMSGMAALSTTMRCTALAGLLLLVATLLVGPALADDTATCRDEKAAPDQRIEACSHAIDRTKSAGKGLAPSYNNRGHAFSIKKNYDRAIQDFDAAIRLDPAFALALMNRCQAYYSKRDYDRASGDCNEAVRLNPKLAAAFSIRGDVYRAKGDQDRAIADFNEAIRLAPEAAWAFNDRGLAYREKGDNDRAIADYNRAIQIDPKFSLPLINRADLYRLKGQHDRAIADSTEAIRLDPKNVGAFNVRLSGQGRA
jgi:tetratricopeptide (TPR) repeat protein